MTKLISLFLLITTTVTVRAAGRDVEALTMIAHGRPLIEKFLADKGAEYGLDLAPAAGSYRARITAAQFFNWPALPLTMGTKYDYSCRPVDVSIPSRGVDARFYVRRTYASRPFPLSHRYRGPRYTLVEGCNAIGLNYPPQLKLRPHVKRVITNAEVVSAAREIVGRHRTNATDFTVHPAFTGEGSSDGEFFWTGTSDLFDCRSLSFALPGSGERIKVGVFVVADRDVPMPTVPADLQTTVKDVQSVRPFTFALVRGCFGSALRAPAQIPDDRTPSAAL